MGEIIQIGNGPKQEKEDVKGTDLSTWVWTCNACGNSTFQLLQDGSMRCACCNLSCVERRHFDVNE